MCPISDRNMINFLSISCLQDLTWMELQMIRKCQPFHCLLLLPQGQEQKEILVHLPSFPSESIVSILSLPAKNNFILMKQAKLAINGDQYAKVFKVRPQKV